MKLILIALVLAFVLMAASSTWLELLAQKRSGLRVLELGALIVLIAVVVVTVSLTLILKV